MANDMCQLETLGCLHPCSGKRLSDAALFGFNWKRRKIIDIY